MPKTFNGIGTKYYGASERQPDGSFITTEWFILGAPVIPLRSLRVQYLGQQVAHRSTSTFYNILGPALVDTWQILQIYGLHLLTWVVLALLLASEVGATAITVVLIAATAFWLWVVPDLLYKAQ